MFETLVPSRIRRTLLEHVLAHPENRFYLRGLAKELQLSVSPLRRELKRLEHSGFLRTHQEANILFYTVNNDSPIFHQLQQASQPRTLATVANGKTEAPSSAGVPAPAAVRAPGAEPSLVSRNSDTPVPSPTVPSGQEAGASIRSGTDLTTRSIWRSALASPAFFAATGVGIALMLMVTALFYITLVNQRLLTRASRALTTGSANVTVVTPPTSSGTMHGSRWQVVPGGFGGFSSGSGNESY